MMEVIKQFKKEHKRLPNVSELARVMNVTRNTVYARLNQLEEQGKIERIPVEVIAPYRLK